MFRAGWKDAGRKRSLHSAVGDTVSGQRLFYLFQFLFLVQHLSGSCVAQLAVLPQAIGARGKHARIAVTWLRTAVYGE